MSNILLCYPFEDGQTGVAIENAFKNLGYDVVAVDAQLQAGDLYTTCERHGGKFELCLASRTLELFEEVQQIKIDYPHIKTAIWNTDVRGTLQEWGGLMQFVMSVDYYFVVANGVVDRWKALNQNTYWLPQGIQEERYHRIENVPKKYDVGFIGSVTPGIHTERTELLAELLYAEDIDFHWYQGVWDEEHNRAVEECRINLACSAYPEIDTCFSVRNWKIIGAGGILLERHHPGIKKFFNNRVQTYNDARDCTRKCTQILGDYTRYDKRAKELYEWAIESQTYTHRIKRMMEIVNA